MPIEPNNISELQFNERDLYLDVRLTTIPLGANVKVDKNTGAISNLADFGDFTGKPTFTARFFRESTGFGITNIKVETNASLQPIIDIEFKDLYGKTVFGELTNDDVGNVDYSALFQWPPPKFVFTFKGYLGSPVTWLLNMKTTSTQYNSDDGSYTIKASFVPNQWGFFSDIPFLYLYAAKKLRADSSGIKKDENSEAFQKATESVIDLMYIGKKVQKKTQKVTKEYDGIKDKLELLKSDPITGLINGTFTFEDPDNKITSTVPGRGSLSGFTDIIIKKPKSNSVYDVPDDYISGFKNLSTNQRRDENIKIKAATNGGVNLSNVNFGEEIDSGSRVKVESAAKNLSDKIKKNIEVIDNAIKAGIYEENKAELEKLTISAVFSRIARDAAFIMGFILDAGDQGYLNNIEDREEAVSSSSRNVIGRYYPMEFEKPTSTNSENGDLGKQVPVNDLGVQDFEKKFVREFITAVSAGIAENRALQAQATQDSKNIKHRINNLEVISENPFADILDWKIMASTIMKRASLIGFLTGSYDPNKPGNLEDDGDVTTFGFDNWKKIDPDDIRKMADNDLQNIDDSILSNLDGEDLEELKTFCLFWISLIQDPDGYYHIFNDVKEKFIEDVYWEGSVGDKIPDENIAKKVVVIAPGIPSLAENSEAKKIIEDIRKFWSKDNRVFSIKDNNTILKSISELYSTSRNSINLSGNIGSSLKGAGFQAYTVEQYLEKFIGPNYFFYGRSRRQAVDEVPAVKPTLSASYSFWSTDSYYCNYNGITFMHVAHDLEATLNPSLNQGALDATRTDLSMDRLTEYVIFSEAQDVQAIGESTSPTSSPTDTSTASDSTEQSQSEEVDQEVPGLNIISSGNVKEDPEDLSSDDKTNEHLKFLNDKVIPSKRAINYTWAKTRTGFPGRERGTNTSISQKKDANGKNILNVFPEYLDFEGAVFTQTLGPGEGDDFSNPDINVNNQPIGFSVYAQAADDDAYFYDYPLCGSLLTGISLENDSSRHEYYYAAASRAFLRQFCVQLLGKIEKLQEETSKVFGQILGRAGEHEDLIYQQMHTLYHQWQILGGKFGGERINEPNNPATLTPNVANVLQEVYGTTLLSSETPDDNQRNDGSVAGGGFRYDYPLQAIGAKEINVAEALINIDPLYEAKANTTVLNVLQQLCSKNNFMFIPIAGNARYNKIKDIFSPKEFFEPKIGNFFQIMFMPTPESRNLSDNSNKNLNFSKNLEDFKVEAFPVSFGDPTNKIIKNVTVGTDENKVTAESIVNLQRIVDNENKNRTVTTDCSLLSVFEGRSYKASLETLGNAQISPMQFFFLRNHTIFTGLYQIIKVSHNISPNDMTTNFEGIKMRYGGNTYGGIPPITLDSYRVAAGFSKEASQEEESGNQLSSSSVPSDGTTNVSGGGTSSVVNDSQITTNTVPVGEKVSTTKIEIPKEVSDYFVSSTRFGTSDSGNAIPEKNYTSRGEITKSTLIQHMNEFLVDRWKGFAIFLNANYPQWKNKIIITSAIRGSIVKGSSSGSQHLRGEAVDFGFSGTKEQKLSNTHELLNALMQYLRINNYEWDQVIFETRDSQSVWVHWSYSRGHRIGIYQNISRMHNDVTVFAPMNNNRNKKEVSSAAKTYTKSDARTNSFNASS
jgi:hypothetical protein